MTTAASTPHPVPPSEHAMPFLIINLGAEMMYVLHDRLQAQSVNDEKSVKVLQDVAKAMFAPSFISELLRPQSLYPPKAVRDVFDRLIHASIMRLSDNSMDKLYDLMCMGAKFKLLILRSPRELCHLTMQHMDSIMQYVGEQSSAAELISNTKQQLVGLFSTMSNGTLMEVRHSLLSVYQDKLIKVSMMLNDELQLTNGVIVLPRGGPVVTDPPFEPVGTITYFANNAPSTHENFPHMDVQQPPVVPPKPAYIQLGYNLYSAKSKDRAAAQATPSSTAPPPPVPSPKGESSSPGIMMATPAAVSAAPRGGPTVVPTQSPVRTAASGPVGETHLLSQLIAPPPPRDTFKLALFQDDATTGGSGGAGSISSDVLSFTSGVDEMRKANADLLSLAGQLSLGTREPPPVPSPVPGYHSAGGGGDDLLDLMDQA